MGKSELHLVVYGGKLLVCNGKADVVVTRLQTNSFIPCIHITCLGTGCVSDWSLNVVFYKFY